MGIKIYGMKKFIIQAVFLIIVILGGVYLTGNSTLLNPFLGTYINPRATPVNNQTPTSNRVKIGNAVLDIEVADTEEKRVKGLSGIDSMPENYGLLFVFNEVGIHKFWMKGVRFPLDFIWINGDTVVDITSNAEPPAVGQSDNLLPTYGSVAVDKVLEVNGGIAAENNIKVGDKIKPI